MNLPPHKPAGPPRLHHSPQERTSKSQWLIRPANVILYLGGVDRKVPDGIDVGRFKDKASLKDRYGKQLQRIQGQGIAPSCIEEAVNGATANLGVASKSSLVIYGEPQSGKTEMMICLTAKLLDIGHSVIVHLMNDSVDLLTQNLKRFKTSGLAPAARKLVGIAPDLNESEA